MEGIIAPNLQALNSYNVNVEGEPEVIWQPIYDYLVYPAAGQLNFRLFQRQVGAGVTFDQTNLEVQSALPVPINMVITNVQVVFFTGSAAGGAAVLVTDVGDNWQDNKVISEGGNLRLEIGSKVYLQDAPLGRFPQAFRLAGGAALAEQTVAVGQVAVQIDYAAFAGRLYSIVPIRLISQQNFNVQLAFEDGVIALPSGVAGRLGCRLEGFRYRLAQ